MFSVGAARVTAPLESTGQITWLMYGYHCWPRLALGSPGLLVPYQTESERPGPPAATQGKTLVTDGDWLTCTGAANFDQLLAAGATVVNTWPPLVQVMCRLRPVSIDDTGKSVSLAPTPPA